MPYAHHECMWSGIDVALNIGTRWRWVSVSWSGRLTSEERTTGAHWMGEVSCPCRSSTPDRPTHSLVIIATKLLQLIKSCMFFGVGHFCNVFRFAGSVATSSVAKQYFVHIPTEIFPVLRHTVRVGGKGYINRREQILLVLSVSAITDDIILVFTINSQKQAHFPTKSRFSNPLTFLHRFH